MLKRYKGASLGEGLGKRIRKTLLPAVAGAALLSGSFAAVIPQKAEAMELPCKECCSSGIMNMMSSMGLMAYSFAEFMNGMCRSMPFFGMFCPDLNKMAGSFFSQVLQDPQLTLDLLYCADGNPAMLAFMLHIMDKNPNLLTQMGNYMGMVGDGSTVTNGCRLTESFTSMALRHNNLRGFFFAKINDHLYTNLTKSMTCQTQTTSNIGKLMAANATTEMQPGRPFVNVFMNLGSPTSSTDGNEMANERLFATIFGNIGAANDFLDGLESLGGQSPELVGAFMDFIFLGKVQDPGRTCSPRDWRCQPRDPSEIVHEEQAWYNLYAIMEGFVNGVAPHYQMDPNHPPTPDSPIPANALFGRFMGMLIDQQGNMTPYAQSFFAAMASAAQVHCWQPAQQFMQMMMGLMQMGQVPFTAEQFEQMMPMLINPAAPAPRDFRSGGGVVSTCEGGGTPPGDQQPPPSEPPPGDEPPPSEPPPSEPPPSEPPPTQPPPPSEPPPPPVTSKVEVTETASLRRMQEARFGPYQASGNFVVRMSGSGDGNLYVRRGAWPTWSRFDCRPMRRDSNETCSFSGPGVYYIMVEGMGWTNNVKLDISYDK